MSAPESDRLDPSVWKIAAVALFGDLLSQLDATIVNVSLSNLALDLKVGISTIQWVTSGYLLALTLVLPLNGWFVDRIGAKALYLWCFSAFTLASALCGLAWSANSLIAFRVLQGLCGGLLAPMAQMMIARAAGKHMARVAGYVSLPVLLAPIFGPIIAGAILQYASWRWLFLVNLPVGAIALLMAILFLPSDKQDTRRRPLDWLGLALLSPGLALFLYGAERIVQPAGGATFAAGIAMMTAFLWTARRKGDDALVDLRLFRGKVFSAAAVTQFLSNGVLFAGQMLLPAFLIQCARRHGLDAGARRAWDDARLSLDGHADGQVRHPSRVRRRSASGAPRHCDTAGPRPPRSQSGRAHPRSFPPRYGPRGSRPAVIDRRLFVGQPTNDAGRDDLAQHRAASRRPDHDDALRVPSRMEAGITRHGSHSFVRLRLGASASLRASRLHLRSRHAIAQSFGRGGDPRGAVNFVPGDNLQAGRITDLTLHHRLRDQDKLVDVMVKGTEADRTSVSAIGNLELRTSDGKYVPLRQVATVAYGMEDPIIWRQQGKPMIIVQADVQKGALAATVAGQVNEQLNTLRAELPMGYSIIAGGITEEAEKGNSSIFAVIPVMLFVIAVLLMLQLQNFSRMALGLLMAPFGLIGVVGAMLPTGTPMGFVAQLGVIALSGMIIRNAVILIQEIDQDVALGQSPKEAITTASVHRARPIVLTACAAILGMIPIASQIFWGPMAFAIIGGLAVATVLTLTLLPAAMSMLLAAERRRPAPENTLQPSVQL